MWGLWGAGTGCPEKLWLLSPWPCWRPGWMSLWATWSSGRCPCPWQGGWKDMIFMVGPFQPKSFYYPMILWSRCQRNVHFSSELCQVLVQKNQKGHYPFLFKITILPKHLVATSVLGRWLPTSFLVHPIYSVFLITNVNEMTVFGKCFHTTLNSTSYCIKPDEKQAQNPCASNNKLCFESFRNYFIALYQLSTQR